MYTYIYIYIYIYIYNIYNIYIYMHIYGRKIFHIFFSKNIIDMMHNFIGTRKELIFTNFYKQDINKK